MKPTTKGTSFQKIIAAKLLEKWPDLDHTEIVSTPGGANGEDLRFSERARKRFPYSIEAKFLARIAVYSFYEQCKKNAKGHTPLVIIKANHKKPLAIIDLEDFLNLI